MMQESVSEDKKFYCENGRLPYSFFTEYIKDYMHNYVLKKLDKIWKDLDVNDIFIDYKLVSLPGHKDYMYSHLWLLDLDLEEICGTYYAVLIQNINTSSPYSMVKCSFDIDEDENDVNSNLTINEIVDLVSKYNNKEKIKELLEFSI